MDDFIQANDGVLELQTLMEARYNKVKNKMKYYSELLGYLATFSRQQRGKN